MPDREIERTESHPSEADVKSSADREPPETKEERKEKRAKEGLKLLYG